MNDWLKAAQLLLPVPRCCLCEAPARRANLCADCLTTLPVIASGCPRCAAPVLKSTARCELCAGVAVPWRSACAALRYTFPVDHLIKTLKFSARLDAGRALGDPAALILGRRMHDAVDVIVPVPLHWRRLWRRGFNQATELATPVARRLGLPLRPRLLRRRRATRQQSGLDSRSRAANLRGAFVAGRKVAGLRVALFDDVVTTGATAAAAAAALREGGAREVRLLTCARAVRPLRPSECESSDRRRSCRGLR